ncbi:MAG: NADH-quinone oxidoreductase subunit D [Chloroflexi bacterium]|nr:NADH-quinone oxidoreductase subunit D [Chloroflexota bacterium]
MEVRTEPFVLNLGPHHPSTHGVFRMRVTFDGEVVTDVEPMFGYLHRGIEKLAEGRTYTQIIPLTDRLDYLAAMSNNWGYVMAVEKLAGVPVPERAEYLRVICGELMRIASHALATGFLINELGAFFTPLMYMYREREKILDLFDMLCGQRLTYNYMRIGGVSHDAPPEFFPAVKQFVREMPSYIDEYEGLITTNEIVLSRTKGVGVLPRNLAINASASGPFLRASGVQWDLRRKDPYSIYDRFKFDIPTGQNGDVYDRYWVRINEMRQSVRILEQALADIPKGDHRSRVPHLLRPPVGEVYGHIEAPRGELGYYLVSDNSIAPYRFHVRPATMINLTTLRELAVGWKLADLIVIFGSIDVVLGEIDR